MGVEENEATSWLGLDFQRRREERGLGQERRNLTGGAWWTGRCYDDERDMQLMEEGS